MLFFLNINNKHSNFTLGFIFKVDNVPSLTSETSIDVKYYIGGSEAIPTDQREKNAIRARYLGAEMLGMFSDFK